MQHKQLAGIEVKDHDRGELVARIATFNAIDSDGDVVVPGAFTDGEKVRLSAYNHASWGPALPIGRGEIRTTSEEAQFHGQVFMENTQARETFEVIKGMGELQEYSWGFDVLESDHGDFDGEEVQYLRKLKVHEVSPVLLGASVGTRTLAVKGWPWTTSSTSSTATGSDTKAALPAHSASTTDAAWDGPAATRNVAAERAPLRAIHAWVDPDGDPDAKSSYKFPHHASPGGPANVRACSAGIAVLNGGRGGALIPDGDRQGVYNHLARHLRDADREPPELRAYDPDNLKLSEQADLVVCEVELLLERAADVLTMRAKQGKSLGGETIESLRELRPKLDGLLTALYPQDDHAVELWRQRARLERSRLSP